jgi:hypothetical protein
MSGFLDPRVTPANIDTLVSAKATTPGTSLATALSATYGDDSELFSDFTSLPDGNPPAKFTSGQTFRFAAEPPKIESGALVTPSPTTSGKATYIEPTALSGKLTRVGAEFIIRRDNVGQTNGSLAMGAWSDPGVVATYPGAYPVAGAHFVINKDRWTYNIYADADGSDIGAGDFTTPLPEGVPLRVEIFFNGDTALIYLPDGSTASIKDARIATYVSTRPFWEPFQGGGINNTHASITRVWADGKARNPGRRGITATEVAVRLDSRSRKLKVWEWRPATTATKSLGSSNWMVPNATVQIVWPASKTVRVDAEAWVDVPANVTLYYSYMLNNSITGAWSKVSTGVGGRMRLSTILRPSGATAFKAGNIVNITWGMFCTGGSGTFRIGTDEPAILTAVPVDGVWNTTDLPIPPVPAALALSAAIKTTTSVELTWTETDLTITSLEVWTRRSSDGGVTWNTPSKAATRAITDSPYTLSTLATGVLHEWWVIAVNGTGAGPESNRVQTQL